jgi:hypothetical protein
MSSCPLARALHNMAPPAVTRWPAAEMEFCQREGQASSLRCGGQTRRLETGVEQARVEQMALPSSTTLGRARRASSWGTACAEQTSPGRSSGRSGPDPAALRPGGRPAQRGPLALCKAAAERPAASAQVGPAAERHAPRHGCGARPRCLSGRTQS